MRRAEVGLFTPTATRERGKRLSTAYNLLYLVASPQLQVRIKPYKQAWEGYFRSLMDQWQVALFESGEVAAHEADFARLRAEVERAGIDVSLVPAIGPPPALLRPLENAAREMSRGWSTLGVGLGVIGGYLLLRFLAEQRR